MRMYQNAEWVYGVNDSEYRGNSRARFALASETGLTRTSAIARSVALESTKFYYVQINQHKAGIKTTQCASAEGTGTTSTRECRWKATSNGCAIECSRHKALTIIHVLVA